MDEENKVEEVQTNTQVKENKGLSIAAMVLGIVSVALFCAWYIALPCGILAIIFGAIEKKKNKNNKFAKSGFILGIISMVLEVVIIVLILIGVGASISLNNDLFERAREAANETEDLRQREESLINELERYQFDYNTYDF